MEVIVNNKKTKNKELVVNINQLTGGVKIFYDGVQAKRVGWRTYAINNDGQEERVYLTGNQFQGFYLRIFETDIEVLRKLFWYEILMVILTTASFITFAVLTGIYERNFWMSILIGGLVGLVGGIATSLSYIFFRKYQKLYLRIIIAVELLLIAVAFNYILVFLMFKV